MVNQVVERVVRCKRHGSPGLCSECNFAKLKFEYPSNDDEIMVLPNKVFCNNFLGNYICIYRSKRKYLCAYMRVYQHLIAALQLRNNRSIIHSTCTFYKSLVVTIINYKYTLVIQTYHCNVPLNSN